MIRKDTARIWRLEGFRRYRPENRISRGMVSAAPWVDVALLVAMYLYLASPAVLQPGVIVKLPEAALNTGSRYGHNVVVLSQEMPGKSTRQEIMFFDDERFLANQPAQMDELSKRLAKAHHERPESPLVIEADKAVLHGTIINLFNMAAAAGFKEVNVATMPSR